MPFRMFLSCCLMLGLATAGLAQDEGQSPTAADTGGAGQDTTLAAVGDPAAAISTQLTFRSHTIGANGQSNFLEGNTCPSPTRMVSGACHPGFSDRVIIVNQYPNIGANTWRCGFRNNDASQRTVWIYTLCAQ